MKIEAPEKIEPIYTKDVRYYFLKGGRSSGKSWAVADRLLLELIQHPDKTLLCIREIQKSIKFSSKKLIEDRIEHHGLNDYFLILDSEIRCKKGKGIVMFAGMQNHTSDSVKSMEGVNLVWCEEAMNLSAYSLEILIPTIRAEGAKLFFTFNPKRADDPIELLMQDVPEEKKVIVHIDYLDNPFCSTAIIEEAEEMKKRRPKKYNHIYLGQHGISEGLIFENVIVQTIREIDIKHLPCYQGLDFGFTNDPSAFSVNYLDTENKKLYVFDGFYQKSMLNEEIADKIKSMNRHRHTTYADCAEPKSIATIRGSGVKMLPSIKGKDSINIGIDFLKNYDIIVNPHLTDFILEFDSYTWELDKITGKPINKPIDEYNHFIDGLRYSVSHLYMKPTSVATNNMEFF